MRVHLCASDEAYSGTSNAPGPQAMHHRALPPFPPATLALLAWRHDAPPPRRGLGLHSRAGTRQLCTLGVCGLVVAALLGAGVVRVGLAAPWGQGLRPKYRSSPGVRTWSPTVLLIWPNGAYVPSADGMGGFHHGMNDPCLCGFPKDSHSGRTPAFCFFSRFLLAR